MSRSNPIDKDEQLERALDAVADIEPDFESALLELAESDTDYEIAYAKAYLAAEGSIQARQATATVTVAKLLQRRNDAKAVLKFLSAKLADRQGAVSARQTLLKASLRTNESF